MEPVAFLFVMGFAFLAPIPFLASFIIAWNFLVGAFLLKIGHKRKDTIQIISTVILTIACVLKYGLFIELAYGLLVVSLGGIVLMQIVMIVVILIPRFPHKLRLAMALAGFVLPLLLLGIGLFNGARVEARKVHGTDCETSQLGAETCYQIAARKNRDSSICQRLKSEIGQKMCVAGLTGDVTYCESLENQNYKDSCYLDIARLSKPDAALCNKIAIDWMARDCRRDVTRYHEVESGNLCSQNSDCADSTLPPPVQKKCMFLSEKRDAEGYLVGNCGTQYSEICGLMIEKKTKDKKELIACY